MIAKTTPDRSEAYQDGTAKPPTRPEREMWRDRTYDDAFVLSFRSVLARVTRSPIRNGYVGWSVEDRHLAEGVEPSCLVCY
jgi:hypothetical protein